MRKLILMLGIMFFIITLFSVTYSLWTEIIVAGMTGVMIGVGVGTDKRPICSICDTELTPHGWYGMLECKNRWRKDHLPKELEHLSK